MPEYTSRESKATAWIWAWIAFALAINSFLNLKLFCIVTYQVCKCACFMLKFSHKQSLQLLWYCFRKLMKIKIYFNAKNCSNHRCCKLPSCWLRTKPYFLKYLMIAPQSHSTLYFNYSSKTEKHINITFHFLQCEYANIYGGEYNFH